MWFFSRLPLRHYIHFQNEYHFFSVQDELSGGMSPTKVKGHSRRKRHSRNSISEADKDLANRSWLKRNAEVLFRFILSSVGGCFDM